MITVLLANIAYLQSSFPFTQFLHFFKFFTLFFFSFFSFMVIRSICKSSVVIDFLLHRFRSIYIAWTYGLPTTVKQMSSAYRQCFSIEDKKCYHFLPSLINDFHDLFANHCHGQVCSINNRQDYCQLWSDEK